MKIFLDYIKKTLKFFLKKIFYRRYKRIQNLQSGLLKNKNRIKQLTEIITRKNEVIDRLSNQITKLKNLLKKGNALERNSEDEMDSFWDNDTSNDIYSNFGKNLAKFVFQNLKNRSFNKFLDMGCGSGDVTFEILKVIKCEEVHAYDFSKSSINKTKEKLSNLEPKLTCMVQDIYKLSGTFDFILCTEVIEHLEDPRAALKSMLNSLSDSGCLLITVPDGRLDRSYQHINFWSPESFAIFFENNIDNDEYLTQFSKVNLNESMHKDDDVGNLLCLIKKK